MSQPEYFGCMGCGRVFKLNDEEIYEYGLHVCNPGTPVDEEEE